MGPATLSPLIAHGRAWIDHDVFDIDRRIKEGDESGWRGDPSMFLMWNPANSMFEVWGHDRAGNQYLACSHHRCDHTLLTKLVAGDPVKNDVIGRVMAANDKLAADRREAERDKRLEIADRMGYAIRQDLGHLYGGRNRQHSIPEVPYRKDDA